VIDLQDGVWAMAVWHSAQVTTSTESSLISILCSRWNPAGRDGVAGPVAIIQFDQRVCLVSLSKMHVIAQPVHRRLIDFRIPRMTDQGPRGGMPP
jgi:hypothetical protein